MRQQSVPVSEAELSTKIAHCDERIAAMRREQSNYHEAHVAARQRGITKAHRRFREEHCAFLVAASSLGEALQRAVVRQYANAEIKPYFEAPRGAFHRALRNSIAHGGSIEYGLTINLRISAMIAPSETFPIPDVRTAAQFGALTVAERCVRGAVPDLPGAASRTNHATVA